MTPEEKYENDFWYVLKKIKKESLYHNEKDGSFTYTVYFPTLFGGNPNPLANPIGENNTSAHDEIVIIEKLISLKIIDRAMVSSMADQYGIQNQREIKSKILQPKFDEEYERGKIKFENNQEKSIEFKCSKGHHLALIVSLTGTIKIKCQKCGDMNVLDIKNGTVKQSVEKESEKNT